MRLIHSSRQHTSSHLHHAETDSSSNFCIQTAFNTNAPQQVDIITTSQLAPEMYSVQVFDIDLHHLPKIGWLNVDHQFYVKIFIHDVDGGTTSCTSPEKPSSMPWSSKHIFNVRNPTTLTLEVFAHRQLHDDQYIGMVQGCVEEFLKYPGAILERLKCVNPQGKEELLRESLEFKLTSIVGAGRPADGSQHTELDHREGIRKEPIASHGYGDTLRTPFPPAVQIFDIDLHHLPRIMLFSTYDSFYVTASVDDHDQKSTTAENPHSLPWMTKLKLNVQASSIISLKVFAKRPLRKDQYIGMVQEGVETLLAYSRIKIYRLMSFDRHGNKHLLCASMEFKIMPLHNTIEHETTQHAEDQLARTIDVSEDTSYTPAMGDCGPNEPLTASTEQVAGVATPGLLPLLLDKISIFVQLAGKFAEAHSYTKMAFVILTAVYNLAGARSAPDRNINQLITVMHETYSLVSGVEELKRVESQEKTINSLAHQTIECSYFIRDYLQNRSGWKQSFSNTSKLDDKILTYEATFKELKNAIQQRVTITTELYVFRVHDLLFDHASKTSLNGMHYACGASIDSQKIGDAPPRTDIMESITSWVNQNDEQQIYLLLGAEGSGKSTIAHTIARQFDAIVRLGSSYCFSRATQDKRNATNLFSTIARDLADHDSQYRKVLWATVKDKRALCETINPLTQFNRFILTPANQMTCIGPVLVVIDGLEHSGNESARKDLLTALAENGAELPRNFKLLVTCRPEEDICAAFEGKSHVIQKHLKHHADSLFVPPPTSGQNQTSRPRFRPQILGQLRQKYVSISEFEDAIRRVIHVQLENAPLRLFNTSTGLLCDRDSQINAFTESTEYKELFRSLDMYGPLQTGPIKDAVAKYFSWVMLSHRWERKELLLHDIQAGNIYTLDPVGTVVKLQNFCKVARNAGYHWAWSDTCCIDQNNNVELQRSVNSMFVWYHHSALTIVYLSDVPPSSESGALANSIWNTRGWTVQEFLAPKIVLFYQADWSLYLDDRSRNHKESVPITQELERSTGINARALVAFCPGMRDAREKLQWSSTRVTTLQEDIAYSLFGIFGVHLPVIYGEKRQNALGRLLQEIIAHSGDITVLDWVGQSSTFNSCLPANISSYEAPPCTLPSLSEHEMQIPVSSLRNNIVTVESASKLYTTLENLGVPRFANARLQLPCIAFPLTEVRRSTGGDGDKCFTYEVKADGLQDLLVTTGDKLVPFSPARRTRQAFLLIRPWNRYDLELVDFADESQSVGDWPDEPGDDELVTRGLRLFVRLARPFGALLLAQQRGGEYKRIASDNDIIAQVRDTASVDNMMDIRTLEIL